MYYIINKSGFYILSILLLLLTSCNSGDDKISKGSKKKMAVNIENIDSKPSENIEEYLASAILKNGKIEDTIQLKFVSLVQSFYKNNEYHKVWSKDQHWQPLADSLIFFIKHSALYGLFPSQYHYNNILKITNEIKRDSNNAKVEKLWSKADLLLTDGFMRLVNDLKTGRLSSDSISLNSDTVLKNNFINTALKSVLENGQLTKQLQSYEPTINGYVELKKGIKHFIDSMDTRNYTYIKFPYKQQDEKDSLLFIKTLQKRLQESKCIDFLNKLPDSAQLADAIINYQKQKKLKPDGKVSTALIKILNINDVERFKRIAITLDRYKQLMDTLPEKYIWVNLPTFFMQVWDHDTVALESKIICGKPATRTPLLNSKITDMVIYPTWTVPNSIITKQLLPKLKYNPNYLARLGLKLVDAKGRKMNTATINWGKYSKGIPYKIMQNSGDNNSLGVMKFNFSNKYSVYLHDTNQRYLFKNGSRALSHGCVRVQEWKQLAYYIAQNDSLNLKLGDTLLYNTDSLNNWLTLKKYRKVVVKNELPLFIRYFSCVGVNGKIKFYDDIYGEDKVLREKYFNDK